MGFDGIQHLYRRSLKRVPAVRNAVFSAKLGWRYFRGTYERYAPPTWKLDRKPGEEPKFAVICDNLTWANLESEFSAVSLTPSDWWETLERERPDVFFCESAWDGLDRRWNNEIYRDQNFARDNRCVLKDILRYCREAGIPTVFWNKEDSPAFRDAPLSFIETALLFDHIFTTARECIPRYEALGHKSVHLMMFGYSPKLFFPAAEAPERNNAVFLGSWYGNNPERCGDMRRLFDMVLSRGIDLEIYDRMSGQRQRDREYPPEYRAYVREGVPYARTGQLMRQARYVININSVKDSDTMFARRVFEAMACGRIVISNESSGLRRLFPGRIWFTGEDFDTAREQEIAAENLDTAERQYTFRKQMLTALASAKIYEESGKNKDWRTEK